jgi:hypothetical protein
MMVKSGKYGEYLACTLPGCDGMAALHKDGTLLSTPANRRTRMARIRAHRVFDTLWKDRPLKKQRQFRRAAYRWLRQALCMTEGEAHIGKFTIEQCDRLIDEVREVKERYGGLPD